MLRSCAELINAVEDDEAEKAEQGDVVPKAVEDLVPEADEIKQKKKLRSKVGHRAFNYVARLHKNLEHPSAEVLAKMLEEVQAKGNVMKAAQGYLCPKCYARQAPSGTGRTAGVAAKNFNARLLIDSAWVDTDDGRRRSHGAGAGEPLRRNWLGAVERKHQVVRRALELFRGRPH